MQDCSEGLGDVLHDACVVSTSCNLLQWCHELVLAEQTPCRHIAYPEKGVLLICSWSPLLLLQHDQERQLHLARCSTGTPVSSHQTAHCQ